MSSAYLSASTALITGGGGEKDEIWGHVLVTWLLQHLSTVIQLLSHNCAFMTFKPAQQSLSSAPGAFALSILRDHLKSCLSKPIPWITKHAFWRPSVIPNTAIHQENHILIKFFPCKKLQGSLLGGTVWSSKFNLCVSGELWACQAEQEWMQSAAQRSWGLRLFFQTLWLRDSHLSCSVAA